MKRLTKEMEYPDAPSGSVSLYNYKEPFMRYETGYGYQGVLLFDTVSDKVQCHLCGEWFSGLGNHLFREHTMRAAEYKHTVGLLQTTALMGESYRAKLIANGIKNSKKNLVPGGKKKKSQIAKQKKTWKEKGNPMETQNKRGTCPLQLLEKVRKVYEEKGRTPTYAEIRNIYPTLIKVHGSFKEICLKLGIPYNKPGLSRTRGKFKKANQSVVSFEYSKEELTNYLKEFKKHQGRAPSASDCRRGLLPSVNAYRNKFGSWSGALLSI